MEKKCLIVGNWKENPESLAEAKLIFGAIKRGVGKTDGTTVVICPPVTYLPELKKINGKSSNLFLGAEDVSRENGGEFTGEVSARMIKEAGASFAIVGHSERLKFAETDNDANLKLKNTLKAGLIPILCFGEKERDEGGDYLLNLNLQLGARLSGVSKAQLSEIYFAYEPLWAIGKDAKKESTPDDVFHIIVFLRKYFSDLFGKKNFCDFNFLYGGSVNEDNAAAYLSEDGITGLLVGRASLSPQRFLKIVKLADNKA